MGFYEKRYDLKNIVIKETGEMIEFDGGTLHVYKGSERQRWEAKLSNVKNHKIFDDSILEEKGYIDFKIKSSENDEFKGTAFVSDFDPDSSGTKIMLTGIGELIG
ncbi:hypothetical protein L2D08_18505 [Domibacillus sp. PGB-M46]|uniref:hypothetical protein n=1 Tax=Domibacillus sp. PGB-M46 TaxID=2910255 RepID=UPI001F59285A|nr:hypothetical protein [Domibacillus sp. PGB-M46]MCI2256338.1 hypothetical protein [Domibacillus sp. PGB-M46]